MLTAPPPEHGTAENHELLGEGKVLESQFLAGANQTGQGPEDGDQQGEHGGSLAAIPGPRADSIT
jgi:hypothetical protein